jgi:hypothetical protein
MLQSLGNIYEYDINNLLLYVASFSNTPLSLVKQKKQIIYLDNYLNQLQNHNENEKIFFIYEEQYIDKYYLDDYAQYYAKCFNAYSKYTSRVHFFKSAMNLQEFEEDFKRGIIGDEQSLNRLQECYLGFMIIRPIANTFISNISFKTVSQADNKRILTKRYDINLYGIKLYIDTIPMQEQDRVVSACATVALWTFYHASKVMCHNSIPSPSNITKSAFLAQDGVAREFPNNGLTPAMMLKSIKQNHCSPDFFTDNILEYIYAYVSNNIPVLLSVEVKTKEDSLGYHAVTVLGYQLDNNKDARYRYKQITHLYLHDDRYGAYLLSEVKDGNSLEVKLYENDNVSNIAKAFEEEKYKLHSIIVGSNAKIRVRYKTIKKIAIELDSFLSEYINKQKENYPKLYDAYREFVWDITLQENINIK